VLEHPRSEVEAPLQTPPADLRVLAGLAKRLEAGSFQLPAFGDAQAQVQVDGATFNSILAGLDFTATRAGWYRRRELFPARRKGIDTIDPA
jgi:hypothetical protein